MDWSEPYLLQYRFRCGAEQRLAEARLALPRPDESCLDEWVYPFQLFGLKDDRVHLVRADDGFLTLAIACSAVRKSLDGLEFVSWDAGPYEVVVPRFVTFASASIFIENYTASSMSKSRRSRRDSRSGDPHATIGGFDNQERLDLDRRNIRSIL